MNFMELYNNLPSSTTIEEVYNDLEFTHTYPLYLKVLNSINSGNSYDNLSQVFPELKEWLNKKYLNKEETEKLTNQINDISKRAYKTTQKKVIRYFDEILCIDEIPPKTEIEIKKYDDYFFCFITTNEKAILCNYFKGGFINDIQNKFLIACTKYEDNRCYDCFDAGYHVMNTYVPFISYKEIHFPHEDDVKFWMNKSFYKEYKMSIQNSRILTYCEGSLGYKKINNVYNKNYMFGFVEYGNIRIIINYDEIKEFDKHHLVI